MNWYQIEGDWKHLKGKVKEKWGQLTEDDLTAIAGKRTRLARELEAHYSFAKDQARKEVDAFAKTLKSRTLP